MPYPAFALLVTADPAVSRRGRAALESEGIKVLEAATYRRGAALLRACEPALCLMVIDIQLETQQADLLAFLRAIPPTVPALFACGSEFAHLQIEGIIPKPFATDELLARVKMELGTIRPVFG